LAKGYKLLIAGLLVLLLFLVYWNPTMLTGSVKKATDSINTANFNPLSSETAYNKTKAAASYQSAAQFAEITNFLPQPWGFLLVLGIGITVILFLMRRFVFHGALPKWFVWVLVIIGIVLIFQMHIPYKTVSVKDLGATCDTGGSVHLQYNFLGIGEMSLATQCMEYKSSGCRPICRQGLPFCQCQANLIDLVFHQEGDWLFGQ
jgi:RsiW-degrading membrane proteinase PrsW (M82 family)